MRYNLRTFPDGMAVGMLLLSGFLCMANIWGFPIYILDEAKNAECAREMWEMGEWVVPTYNYELRVDKPPLHYWFMMLSYSLFGSTAFAARFFSAIMGGLTAVAVWYFTRLHVGKAAAFWSVTVLACSLHFGLQFHLAVPDPYLICTLFVAVASLYTGFRQNNAKWLYGGYLIAGLGALAKGPVAPGLIGLIFLMKLVTSKELTWQNLRRLRVFSGVLVFFLVALPWYIAVHEATRGAWTNGFFFRHNLGRFASTMEGHGGFPGLILLIVGVGLLPFSLFFPQALGSWWKQRKDQGFLWLCGIALVVIVLFFSLSRTQLPNYPVPAYPFGAILLGSFLCRFHQSRLPGWRTSLWIYLVLTLLIPVAAWIGIGEDRVLHDRQALAFLFIPLPVGAIFALWAGYRHQQKGLLAGLVISWLLTNLLFFFLGLQVIRQHNQVEQSLPLLKDHAHLAYYKRMNRAYVFALQRKITHLENETALEEWWRMHPEGRIITFERHFRELEGRSDVQVLFQQKELFENETAIIFKKEP